MLSQCDRVVRALIQHPAGVSQPDFDAPVDGGKPIRRLASRIVELRDRGYVIETRRLPNRVALYVLVSVPERPPARPDVPLEAESVRVTVQPLDGFLA